MANTKWKAPFLAFCCLLPAFTFALPPSFNSSISDTCIVLVSDSAPSPLLSSMQAVFEQDRGVRIIQMRALAELVEEERREQALATTTHAHPPVFDTTPISDSSSPLLSSSSHRHAESAKEALLSLQHDHQHGHAQRSGGVALRVLPAYVDTYECINPIANERPTLQQRLKPSSWQVCGGGEVGERGREEEEGGKLGKAGRGGQYERELECAVRVINKQCGTYREVDGSLQVVEVEGSRLEREYAKRVERLHKKLAQLPSPYSSHTLPASVYSTFDEKEGVKLVRSTGSTDGKGQEKQQQQSGEERSKRVQAEDEKGEDSLASSFVHCPRLPLPSSPEEFITSFVLKGQPAVFEKATIDAWPALKKWNFEWLAAHAGERQAHVKVGENGVFEGPEDVKDWYKKCFVRVGSAEGGDERGLQLHCRDTLTEKERKDKVDLPSFVRDGLVRDDVITVRAATMEMRVGELLDRIRSSREECANPSRGNTSCPSFYLEYSSLEDTLGPSLASDAPLPRIAERGLTEAHRNIWIGGGVTRGKMHFDPFENLMGVISGQKDFYLVDPFSSDLLEEGHLREGNLVYKEVAQRGGSKGTKSKQDGSAADAHVRASHYDGVFVRDIDGLAEATSRVMTPLDLHQPDRVRFGQIEEVRKRVWKCEVKEGDLLFLPSFWWHEVVSTPGQEGATLAVNYWFDPFYTKPFPCSSCRLRANRDALSLLDRIHEVERGSTPAKQEHVQEEWESMKGGRDELIFSLFEEKR